MYDEPLFLPSGDQALVVELGDSIDPDCNRKVHNLLHAIEEQEVAGVVDLIPTYRSLMVQYDPMEITYADLQYSLTQIERGLDEGHLMKPRTVEIPTLYSGEPAPDLEFVAQNAGISTEEAIAIHSGTDYLVYMMGFTPGFPYLGGLSEKLVTPRLTTPRTTIPAGSVGIAESQTGVYPVESPGGWRIIGRTPIKLFDPTREPPSSLAAGDYVRFVPISGHDEFIEIQAQVEKGEYRTKTGTVQ